MFWWWCKVYRNRNIMLICENIMLQINVTLGKKRIKRMLIFTEDRHRKSNIKNHNNNKSMKIENTVKALSHEKCDNFLKLSLLLREYIFFT